MKKKKNDSVFFKTLRSIYFDPRSVGSFGGKERLYQAAKKKNILITRGVVEKVPQSSRNVLAF